MTEVTHFTLDEYIASDMAVRQKIGNFLPVDLIPNAWATLAMLETIRAHLSAKAGREVPVTIVSGYRCPALNSFVGGVSTSDHMRAMSADIRAPAFGSPYEVARELAAHVEDLGIGQLIMEYPGPHAWVHVSTRIPSKALNRVITINGQGTEVGIHA